jgi:hypothetical protein
LAWWLPHPTVWREEFASLQRVEEEWRALRTGWEEGRRRLLISQFYFIMGGVREANQEYGLRGVKVWLDDRACFGYEPCRVVFDAQMRNRWYHADYFTDFPYSKEWEGME